MADRRVVAFQGRRSGRSAFALINSRWSDALTEAGYEVTDFVSGPPAPDAVVHHDFESAFMEFTPPPGSRGIAVRTWDFGPLPLRWAEKINREFAEYWAHTRWLATLAERAGVDKDRIAIVPHGIDPAVFRPDGPSFSIDTDRRFRFLFVGGVSLRKGSDILLEAYRRAFTAQDDVCLVLKDHSGDLFYKEHHARSRIDAMRADAAAPAIVHMDTFLSEADLAALNRTCDVSVFPYRAEGFCIPILEAMACGTPAIVPAFGACLDFCDDTTSHMVKARRIRAPVSRSFKVALGFEEEVAEVDFCELPIDRLAEAMRAAYAESVAERSARAAAGVARAHGTFTWTHACDIVRGRIDNLLRQPSTV